MMNRSIPGLGEGQLFAALSLLGDFCHSVFRQNAADTDAVGTPSFLVLTPVCGCCRSRGVHRNPVVTS